MRDRTYRTAKPVTSDVGFRCFFLLYPGHRRMEEAGTVTNTLSICYQVLEAPSLGLRPQVDSAEIDHEATT